NIVIAIGFMMIGFAVSTPAALEGSIYYLIHDIIVKAMLYLIIGTMIMLTGKTRIKQMSGLIRNYPILGWLFFIDTLSLAVIPPFSGFIGKILIGQGTVESVAYLLLALAFLSSIFVLYSLLRIFMNCFWGETIMTIEDEKPLKKSFLLPSLMLAVATLVLGLGAETLAAYVTDASALLMKPDASIDAVLPGDYDADRNRTKERTPMAAPFLSNIFIAFLWMLVQDDAVFAATTFFAGCLVGIVIVFVMYRFSG